MNEGAGGDRGGVAGGRRFRRDDISQKNVGIDEDAERKSGARAEQAADDEGDGFSEPQPVFSFSQAAAF